MFHSVQKLNTGKKCQLCTRRRLVDLSGL